MSSGRCALALLFCLLTRGFTGNVTNVLEQTHAENALAKLVKMFSKPGAFKRMHSTHTLCTSCDTQHSSLTIISRDEITNADIDAILGENSIETSFTSCPMGEEGLECRRAEARRSVDCPRGDCFCYNCAVVGPDLWASCCRESLRCCSHLAAACRTCDHPTLYPFCAKHFKKCLTEHNEKKQN
ncbi:uncharacterized protein LOC105183223 isoform X1 [Harpegnathos saltator]|uniref:uncharacterized protein LOC105183223 isoform X1 n=1 Tax=Harpegnathos saltator TaxID=610380 RepID=UPI00058DB57C|nr:uncharacterized protein LOC105183223 isoform X1 [Harpegnathos saltator]